MLGPLYNIVGFDPRSVNNSGPHLDYYDCMKQPLDEMEMSERTRCQPLLANGDAKYAGTVAVVQDMLNFIELRNEEGGKPGNEAKLSFFGASYGTTLGATFAATYPDRVERMILDAVVDAAKYYKAELHSRPSDATDVLDHFAPMCFAAGRERCAFHGGSRSAAEVQLRIKAIFDKLNREEIIVTNPDGPDKAPYALDAIDLGYAMFMVAYHPLGSFPTLATVLVELEKGNGATLVNILKRYTNLLADQAGDEGQGSMISCLDPAIARRQKSLVARWDNMPLDAIDLILAGSDMYCEGRDIIVPPSSQQFLGESSNSTTLFVLTPPKGSQKRIRASPYCL
jgi:pimeloyl-ACP methyl ester carboxylesterase